MAVPIYAFAKLTARPEFSRLCEEQREAAWWEAIGEVGRQEAAAGVQTVVSCHGIASGPDVLLVKRYPDIDTYIKWGRIYWSRTNFHKYFDLTVELGCTDDDVTKAFGETKAEKPTW